MRILPLRIYISPLITVSMITPTLLGQQQKKFLGNPENLSQSLLMHDLFDKILSLAKLEHSVFIIGEIGSGKKRIAKIIHNNSTHSAGPFYSFYCLDIDEKEYEGAFWGHLEFEDNFLTLRYEVLENVVGGTLFLDQFSELSLPLMLKIIDSLNKGSKHLFRHNKMGRPRFILSFNQESYQELIKSSVWDQLLEELNPVVVMLPPLRERKEDIPILINYFLQKIKHEDERWKNLSISDQALRKCFDYAWQGNMLQLKNALIRGAILSYGQTIESKHLPFSMDWQFPYELNGKKINP